jgi:hypothetical protein
LHRSFLKHGTISCLVALSTILALSLTAVLPVSQPVAHASATGSLITNVSTDKARYNPGDAVKISVDLTNTTGVPANNILVKLLYKHLTTLLRVSSPQRVSLGTGVSTILNFTWNPPTEDFQGYAVEAWAYDTTGNVLDNSATAVDVSSDWTHFPRYGYLSTYAPQSTATSQQVINQLKDYHIDALQFYDWQYEHHVPLAGTVANPAATWNDIANRTTSRQTVLDYLNTAHSDNILGFAYNAANAAYGNYATDGSGVQPAWGIYNNSDCTGQDGWDLPGSWATSRLALFNPADPNWQQYIFGQENNMFKAYPFDGWHVDQLVVGNNYTCSGQKVNIYDTFAGYLNNAKKSTGKRIIFNNSGGSAGESVAQQTKDDAMYYEWFNNRSYADILNDVENTHNWSTNKQPISVAYMDRNSTSGTFNAPGILLADAAIFAAGSDHLELGDGNSLLDNEYFPNKTLQVSSDLQKNLQNYYNFVVAYENLLRGGLSLNNQFGNNVQLSANGVSLPVSGNSQPNSVYKITRTGNGYDTINLINALGENNTDLFDANGTYPTPTAQTNVTVKYYYSGTVHSVAWASPDYKNGESFNLNYTTGFDNGGKYVTFTVPSLAYWDLIYINGHSKTTTTTPTTQTLFSDNFSAGNSNQWTSYDGDWSVCKNGTGANDYAYCGNSTGENISLAGSTNWSDYTVQTDFTTAATDNAGVCLLGRVEDGSHFYQAELKTGDTWDIWRNNGGNWQQVASGYINWSANTTNSLKLSFKGGQLTLSYAGNGGTWQTLGSSFDAGWTSGKIGLRVWGTTGNFDNVKVTSN